MNEYSVKIFTTTGEYDEIAVSHAVEVEDFMNYINRVIINDELLVLKLSNDYDDNIDRFLTIRTLIIESVEVRGMMNV